ncbi:MAG: FxsA family protein [Actinomycetota bacterium]|nr:FxsA family protein [Actinomycetota bacterium]MDP2288697.1 FxsA family protein [Actinomycetota bacterium]
MAFLRRLVIFGYPLLEIVTFFFFVTWFGWGWALFISFIGIPIGWMVFRNAGRAALAAAKRSAAPSRAITFRMLSGVLFMIPGFWTDIAALLLFVPGVQARLAAPFTNLNTPSGGMNWRVRSWGGSGDIVEGVVIHENDDPFNTRSVERDG